MQKIKFIGTHVSEGSLQNIKGWESVAGKWQGVKWPRKPKWDGEFEKVAPLLSSMEGKKVLVLGATPEFRAWLYKSDITLYEKSEKSLKAMTSILKSTFSAKPLCESIVKTDWENGYMEKNTFSLILGDIVTGYMQTPERLSLFLAKLQCMLKKEGFVVLREFVNVPHLEKGYGNMPADMRRWAYINTPGFAIDAGTNTFYEEMLSYNLKKAGGRQTLGTCANPPRTRLMLGYEELLGIFSKFFECQIAIKPTSCSPALFVMKNKF